jgi:uncharacterized protein (TIGR02284 family)
MQKTTVDRLTDLINICEDAREFYTCTSHQTNSRSLRETFRKIASTRESVIINLKSHIISLAGEMAEGEAFTSYPANIFKFRKTEIRNLDFAMIEKLEEAENKTLDKFRKALEIELSDATVNLIERQMQMLNETRSHMKFLKQKLRRVV